MKDNNVTLFFAAIVAGITFGFICLHFLCGPKLTEQLPEQHIYDMDKGIGVGMCKPGDPE